MKTIKAIMAMLLICQLPATLHAQQSAFSVKTASDNPECALERPVSFYAVNDFDDSGLDKAAIAKTISQALVQACAEDLIVAADFEDFEAISVVTGSQPGRIVIWPCDDLRSEAGQCYNIVPQNSLVFELTPSDDYTPDIDSIVYAFRCSVAPETIADYEDGACLVD